MPERETLEVDVLIVGGGPAGLSAALRLAQLQKAKGGEPLAIAVIGGVLASMILSLVVTPAVHYFLSGKHVAGHEIKE